MVPSYLKIPVSEIEERADLLYKNLFNCNLCPRECFVDRSKRTGICKTGVEMKVASFNLHFGEEPPITGINGSGTIFFSGCNLNCLFCQNYPISHLNNGKNISLEELAFMMINLQEKGAHNINFVTPSHVVPQILKSLVIAIKKGLKIPIVWNSSGYEKVEVIKYLENIVDIYMPDCKYMDKNLSKNLSNATDYPEVNKIVLKEMFRQVGNLKLNNKGIAEKGVLLRHLVLPGNIENSKKVLKFLKEEISKDIYLSLMSQYHPAYKTIGMPPFDRGVNSQEYEEILNFAVEIGIENGYRQEIPVV